MEDYGTYEDTSGYADEHTPDLAEDGSSPSLQVDSPSKQVMSPGSKGSNHRLSGNKEKTNTKREPARFNRITKVSETTAFFEKS